jgi:hypothetical protein
LGCDLLHHQLYSPAFVMMHWQPVC